MVYILRKCLLATSFISSSLFSCGQPLQAAQQEEEPQSSISDQNTASKPSALGGTSKDSPPGYDGNPDVGRSNSNADSINKTSGSVAVPVEPSSGPPEQQNDETIIVTGSHIRDGLVTSSNLDVVTSSDIRESGYAAIHQYMQTYVQNFSGGPSDDTDDISAQGNFTEGASINLRGLGASATLVLINGRRVAVSGLDTSFTDISQIPSTAIDRIEILTDGGSAIYGTDAIAGVVNIILRQKFDGDETRARFGAVTKGNLKEYLAGHTTGRSWDDGSFLLSYEYFRRTPLDNASRSYTSTQDHRKFGGGDRRLIYSNPGNILDPVTFLPVYAIPNKAPGELVSASDLLQGQVNLGDLVARGQQLGRQNRHSLIANIEQDISSTINIFLEGRYVNRAFKTKQPPNPETLFVPSTNPFFIDPFGGSSLVFVAYDMSDVLGDSGTNGKTNEYNVAVGSSINLPFDTQIRLSASYGEQSARSRRTNAVNRGALNRALADTDPNSAFNPFTSATPAPISVIDSIKSENFNKTNSRMLTINAVADGPLFRLPAGDLKYALGIEYQKAEFDSLQQSPNFDDIKMDLNRNVKAVFGELQIPIFNQNSNPFFGKRLDFSVAARYDDYSDFGTTTNPKIGIIWQIFDDLLLKSTWGTSFRAPNMSYLDESRNFVSSFIAMDPRLPGGSMNILYKTGGSKELNAEKANNWTIGAQWAPEIIPGSSVEVGYFRIHFKERIRQIGSPLWPVLQPEEFGQFAILNPSQRELTQYCALPYIKLYDTAICENPTAVGALVDFRYQNVAATIVKGLDVSVTYNAEISDANLLTANINASYIMDFKERLARGSLIERVDTIGYPVDLRLRGSLTWGYDDISTSSIIVNYTDSYTDNINSDGRKVGSWVTVDLTVTIHPESVSRRHILHGTAVTFGVLNIFNDKPPFVDGPDVAYDPNNADPLGRFISIDIIKRW